MKLDTNTIMVLLLVGVLIFSQSTNTQIVTSQSNINDLVNPGIIFRGSDIFNSGTDLNTEFVRVLKPNGENKDLGSYSLASGSLSTDPQAIYKLYFFLNSSTYYPSIKTYTAPSRESDEIVVGQGCKIDTAPSLSTFDTNGNIQSATSYAQSISANQVKNVYVQISSNNDKCYGMPGAGYNIVCFSYSATAFSNVETNTGIVSAPSTIADITGGQSLKCYKFNTLNDTASIKIPVTLTASSTEPTNAHNISVYIEDISFTLSEEDLSEIYGYEDEDGNNLSATYQETKIYIS